MTIQAEREKLAESYFSEIYTFKPSITDKSQPNVENFFNRLQVWVDKRNDSFKKDLETSLFDRKSGQKLFQPTINNSLESIFWNF